jgi:uncharacterized damage-inducible protein DinB
VTYYGGKEMAISFRTVRNNTIKIAEEIPENQYGFRASPETRTVALTLAHIAIGYRFQHHIHANKIDDLAKVNFPELAAALSAEENKPRSKAELIAFLKAEGDTFAAYLESLPEALLAEPVKLPPTGDRPFKSRFEMLLGPKEHEMHHRGQLMVLQRMIGQVPHLTRLMQERMAQHEARAAAQP